MVEDSYLQPKSHRNRPRTIWFTLDGIMVTKPNCSSITYNQANGRFHRPSQKSDEVRVFVPYYQDTTQEIRHLLLGHKVRASRQTRWVGHLPDRAGAVSQDSADAMAPGKAIYKMLQDGVPDKPHQGAAASCAAIRLCDKPIPG